MYQEIAVTSFYFVNGNTKKSFPRRIETATGQQINFVEEGLRCVVQKGHDLLELFTMSDGQAVYKLAHRPQRNEWVLVN